MDVIGGDDRDQDIRHNQYINQRGQPPIHIFIMNIWVINRSRDLFRPPGTLCTDKPITHHTMLLHIFKPHAPVAY